MHAEKLLDPRDERGTLKKRKIASALPSSIPPNGRARNSRQRSVKLTMRFPTGTKTNTGNLKAIMQSDQNHDTDT